MNSGDRIEMVPRDRIKVGPNIRTRIDPKEQNGLIASIQANGILIALVVFRNMSGDLELFDGWRRYCAANFLELPEVPVRIIEEPLSPAKRTQQQLVIQVQRAALNAMEYARAFAALIEATGCTNTEAAKNVGVSNATVTRCLKRLTLPTWIQQLVEEGKIRGNTADAIADVEDPNRQAELARKAAEGGLTRDEAMILAKQPCVAMPNIAEAAISEEIAEEHAPQERIQAVAQESLPRRFSARLASGTVTITSAALEPQSVIEILTELLAKARKLSARGVTGDLFFKSLRESTKPS